MPVSRMTLPNGVTTTWSYGANRDLITRVQNGTISAYGYVNDAVGRRTSMSRSGSAHANPDAISYTYNDRSELTGAQSNVDATYSYSYAYDPIGNRTTASEAGVPWTYTANSLNQYTSATENNVQMDFSYDLDGSMTYRPVDAASGWTQVWNGENRMVETFKGNDRLEFRYDYMGRRFEKKVYQDSVLVKHSLFVYDGFKCVEELDALDGNAVTMRHAWQPFDVGLDIILTSTDADGTSYFLHDANKNVIQKATTDKTLLGKYSYEPFGTHLTLVNDDIGFSSEMAEKLQGIIYYNFRYYSLRIGRWISTDPLDDYSGYNLIRFVDNNPVDSFDLYGLETINVKSFIDSIPIDYSNLYREMINQNNSIENINNDHNDYCCVNGNIQEKVTDDAGRKCCLKQLRWIAIRHRAKNEWYDWGHTFMDLGYIGGRRYAYGFYMFSNLYSDEDVKKYSKSVYYRACPISITKLYKEMLDSDSIFTRRWFYFPINLYPIPGLFPYIKARNCTGAVSDWLKYAGFIPPSWLASQLPYFFKAGESK